MSEESTAKGANRSSERPLEALLKLNRAVQRATVYPDGHPSVAAAANLFHHTLELLLAERGALSITVTSERLLIDDEPLSSGHEALAWLTRRLYEQGIGALAFGRGVPADDVTTLVGWLARKGVAPEPPTLRHVAVTLIDYGRARFEEEQRAAREEQADPLRLWRSLLAGLTAGWYQGQLDDLPADPEACAAELSGEIERNEGVGAASFTAAIVGAGLRLPKLPEAAREVVRTRLASFVAGLSPEMRRQLLHVDPGVSSRRQTFLAEMADALPDTTLMEVLADLDTRGDRIPDSFISMLSRLVTLSVRDPLLRELTETKLASCGLPRGLTLMEPTRVRAALEETLQRRVEEEYNPTEYQETLDQLGLGPSRGAIGQARRRSWTRYEEITSDEATGRHVSAIALRLLVALPEHPGSPIYLTRLIGDIPRALETGAFGALHEAATSVRDLLVLRNYLPDEVVRLIEEYLAHFRQASLVLRLLVALEAGVSATPHEVLGLLRVGGGEAAFQTLERQRSLPEGEARQRLTAFLLDLKPEVFADVVARARVAGGASLKALLALLAHPAAPGRLDHAHGFLTHRDAEVRLAAYAILLNLDLPAAQQGRYLQRALADPDLSIRHQAVALTERRGDAVGVAALRTFVLSAGREDVALRDQIVETLGAIGTHEAQAALAALLGHLRLRIALVDVRACRRAVAALRRATDPAIRASVSTWRRSPSGWVAWLFSASREDEAPPTLPEDGAASPPDSERQGNTTTVPAPEADTSAGPTQAGSSTVAAAAITASDTVETTPTPTPASPTPPSDSLAPAQAFPVVPASSEDTRPTTPPPTAAPPPPPGDVSPDTPVSPDTGTAPSKSDNSSVGANGAAPPVVRQAADDDEEWEP